ncbi:MAG: hypothetical protein R3C02_25690 [Planctomycetaceae bacterium]
MLDAEMVARTAAPQISVQDGTHHCSTATHGGPMASHRRSVSGQADDAAGGRTIPPRPCLEGILWILTSGARWKIYQGVSSSSTAAGGARDLIPQRFVGTGVGRLRLFSMKASTTDWTPA